jgi:uncharacterized protein YxjI
MRVEAPAGSIESMGLFNRSRNDVPAPIKYQMREKLLSIGDDYWIENSAGQKVFKVNGKAVRFRETFILEDSRGAELAKIQERKLSVRDKMHIQRGSSEATVHKALIGIRDRYTINPDSGPDLKAKGNFVDHEYDIERDGHTVATVSKKWFRLRDTYGVEINANEDQAFILAITVCIDELSHD